jgi:BlaI family penicillinase repressor
MGETGLHITAAELRILKVLWEEGALPVRRVKEALTEQGGDPPAYTTVMTMMKQLAEKGALTVNRDQTTYIYAPAVRRTQVLRQRLMDVLHTAFDGKVEDLVMQLAEATDLSAEDLRRIEARIAEREQEGEGRHKNPRTSRRKTRESKSASDRHPLDR